LLVTAFGKKSNQIRKQALVEFQLGQDELEVNFLISPQLIHEAILGCQFMKDYGIGLKFETESFTYFRENQIVELPFHKPQKLEKENALGDLKVNIFNPLRNSQLDEFTENPNYQLLRINDTSETHTEDSEMFEVRACQGSEVEKPRSLTLNQLRDMIGSNGNLNLAEREELFHVLESHIGHMSTKPGKFNLFKYRFQVNTDKAIVGY
jgi:hypothetical protein